MKTTGKLMIIGMSFALFGVLFKLMMLEGAGLLLTLSLLFLSILSFVQFFLALIQIKTNKMLKVVSALLSYTFSMSFMAILFRLQWWEGAGLLMLVSALPLLILTVIFIFNYKKLITDETKNLVKVNLFLPWCFIVLFTKLHFLLPAETFYNTFSSQRDKQTYQEYREEFEGNSAEESQ